jgi:hypothetical protein
MKGKMQGLWERIYWRADAKIPRPAKGAGFEFKISMLFAE